MKTKFKFQTTSIKYIHYKYYRWQIVKSRLCKMAKPISCLQVLQKNSKLQDSVANKFKIARPVCLTKKLLCAIALVCFKGLFFLFILFSLCIVICALGLASEHTITAKFKCPAYVQTPQPAHPTQSPSLILSCLTSTATFRVSHRPCSFPCCVNTSSLAISFFASCCFRVCF